LVIGGLFVKNVIKNYKMNNYIITYVVMGSSSPMPLTITVIGDSEEDAKERFLCTGNFYYTNDARKVVISSIRKL